jgi:hypothetical protein
MSSRVPERRMLKATKTALKPRIKLRVMGINRGLGTGAAGNSGAPAAVLRGGAVPPRKQSQEGIRGSTQGDKKESSPAVKARRIDNCSDIKKTLP